MIFCFSDFLYLMSILNTKLRLKTKAVMAFTLLEVLISVSLLSILALSVFSITSQSRYAYRQLSSTQQTLEHLHFFSLQLLWLQPTDAQLEFLSPSCFQFRQEQEPFLRRFSFNVNTEALIGQTLFDPAQRVIFSDVETFSAFQYSQNQWHKISSASTFPLALDFAKFCFTFKTDAEEYCLTYSAKNRHI